MSSGIAIVASIRKGTVTVADLWGAYAPDEERSIEVTTGNKDESAVYLTYEELFELARQITEFQREAAGEPKLQVVRGGA